MAWKPSYGKHVSQLHSDGSGWADCWEASLARYLLEAYDHFGTSGEWHTVGQVLDPHAAAGVPDLINRISILARGAADSPNNTDTSLDQAAASLRAYGLPVTWTTSYADALAAAWSICLVHGAQLAPAQYPPSWFGADDGHFIAWLPNLDGADNWFNDPLAYDNGQQDCRYDLAAVQGAFQGAYLLPDTGHGEGQAQPAPHPKPAGGYATEQRAALKPEPSHTGPALADVPAGTRVELVDSTGWALVRLPSGAVGWLVETNLRGT